MNTTPTRGPDRILVVGRSPSVLIATVDILRARGYIADATNQFDQVLDTYDVTELDVLVFGGMVPADTKQYLREEVERRNPGVTIVAGLAGIAGLIAAQVEAVTSGDAPDGAELTYNDVQRAMQVRLTEPAHVAVEALWHTSFTPPEPESTSIRVFDGDLGAGFHVIALPDQVPSEASFATIAVDHLVRVFTVGAMPTAVTRLIPTSTDTSLPDVGTLTTNSEGQ
jgi:hypothetical protein